MKRLSAIVSMISMVGFLAATVVFAQPRTDVEKGGEPSAPHPSVTTPSTPPSTVPGHKTGQEALTPSPSIHDLYASSLIGASVENPQGEKLGKIDELVIDPQDARIKSAVVSVGGFLGIGSKSVAVPWNEVKPGPNGQTMVVAMGKSELENAPEWKKPEEKTTSSTSRSAAPSATAPMSGPRGH
jgi:sporulation protein YlmC with PRC-barrel domain